jgi:hypothetical protein
METEKKKSKKLMRYLPYILVMLALVFGFAGCGSQQGQEEQTEVHVAVSGSDESGTGAPQRSWRTVGGR